MSAHDDIDRVEQLLRSAPAPTPVPPGLIDVAREAALGGGERRTVVAAVRPRVPRVPRLRLARLSAGVAVMAAATVDFGRADQGTRPMLVKIDHLRPAPAGSYYEMWFQVSGDKVSAVTFNTGSSGRATVRAAISANMHWGACWVTLEKVGGPDGDRVVLRST